MWAVRRSLNYVRHRGEYGNALRASVNVLDRWKCNANAPLSSNEGALVQQHEHEERSVCSAVYVYGGLIEVGRGFASRATAKNEEVDKSKVNSRDDEREEGGFSELDSPPSHKALPSESESESDMVEAEGQVEVDPYLSEVEGKEAAARSDGKNITPLSQVVVECSHNALRSKLDEWIQDGHVVTREEAISAFIYLRRRKMFGRALVVSEWLWEKKAFTFNEIDYANRLDLIAKVHDIYRAEKYLATIPSEMRGYKTYKTLLANCSRVKNIEKTEEVLKKMKDAGYSLSVFECNNLLLLYKGIDMKKIGTVLEMMEHEGIKPDSFTYHLLIDAKGLVGDIVGMEQILETMKAEGMVTDSYTLVVLARHYIRAGNTKKAETFVEELEKYAHSKSKLYDQQFLLPLYADLGRVGEVERIWKEIESSQKHFLSNYIAGIRAWGKLGDIEKAEIVFEKLLSSGNKLKSCRPYSALLNVYADHHLLLKGEEFVKRMFDSGIAIDPSIWEALVRLYVNSGDVEKADFALFKACHKNKVKPHYGTMITILKKYAERGDIANAEKIFDRLTTLGYGGRLKSYESLLEAYIKARVPAYGFKERMVAAKVFPNRRISNLLQQVDAFKKNSLKNDLVSDILDRASFTKQQDTNV